MDEIKVETKIPQHIAIIMDGNGRWAKKRHLPRTAGHKEGAKRVREILRGAKELGVKVITIFAFSTENWDRPQDEIATIFSYMEDFLNKYKDELIKEGIKLTVIGRRDRIDKKLMKAVENLEAITKDNKNLFFNIALDYGGRWDIIEATKKIHQALNRGEILESDLTENIFHNYLSLYGIPEVDLLIRTSGEERISNFLLWDLAYAEFYFPQIYWPEFTVKELEKAIDIYSQRERRFGKV